MEKSNEIIFIFKTHDRKRKGEKNRWPVSMALSIKEKGDDIITKQQMQHVMK